MKLTSTLFIFATIIMLLATSCKKDSETDPQKGTIEIGITDARSTQKAGSDIIDASKLSKFELTISRVELRNEDAEFIPVLDQELTVNLSNYQGTVKTLSSINVPIGNYTGVIIYFSGISVTYDGNNYTASTTAAPVMTLGNLPGMSFSTSEGIPNAFEAELGVDLTFNFEVGTENTQAFNITFDAVAACYEIEFNCPACTPALNYFAGLRPVFQKQMNIYFEEGIQQIKHSPPLGIKLAAGTTANYFGIHTFKDFNGIGGNITTHASQHVYRGTDGALEVPIGALFVNSTPLTPNTISATGQTDVRADEIFDFAAINADLIEKSYTLVAGNTYYFSLKKGWTITSGSTEYTITRMCEPIPVLWPAL